AYGDLSMRSFCDLDILIHEKDFERMYVALKNQGFPPVHPVNLRTERKFMVYQKKNLPVPFKDSHLEIHWKITERFLSVSFEMDQLWDRAHLVFLHNREIKTFSPEDMVIVLCVHGTKHFWQNLKWLADLIHLISQYPDLDWHIIWERAEKMGVRRIVSLGLDLAQEQGGIKYPGDFKHLLSSGNDFKKCVNNVQTNFFHFQSSKWFSISPAFYLKLREKFKD